MVSPKLHQDISAIIAIKRLDMTIISESIATEIINKFIESGWIYDEVKEA